MSIKAFVEALAIYYDRIPNDRMLFLIGDMNIDLPEPGVPLDIYLNCLLVTGLTQCIDKLTRMTVSKQFHLSGPHVCTLQLHN